MDTTHNGKPIFSRIWDAHRMSGWYRLSDLTQAEIWEGIREGNASLDAILAAPTEELVIPGFNRRSFTAAMLSSVLPRLEEAEAVGLGPDRRALQGRLEDFLEQERTP